MLSSQDDLNDRSRDIHLHASCSGNGAPIALHENSLLPNGSKEFVSALQHVHTHLPKVILRVIHLKHMLVIHVW